MEQALINECGYNGTLPYWNWPLWAKSLETSPLFDGSEFSLSGNGLYNASVGPTIVGANASIPQGTGGGCVVTGPFANMTVPWRHFQFSEVITDAGVLPPDALDYNPHCFARDLNDYVAETYTNQSSVDYLIYKSPSIADFQNVMSGTAGTLNLGVHGGGHLSAGPDLFDFFASPSDPAFHLHHAMIDLLWTMWQAQNPLTRQYALSGTSTTLNIPPSPNVTLATVIGWGLLDQSRPLSDLMSVTEGPFCYRYEY